MQTVTREMKYWEDLKDSRSHKYGPLTFSQELLDSLLEMMGEKHPIHADPAFALANDRRKPIVPGGFIHSITSGWIVRHGSPVAIIGLRSMQWNFIKPLYPDVPFFFTTETERSEEINERAGLVWTKRTVMDENGSPYAIGRMNVVMKRRDA